MARTVIKLEDEDGTIKLFTTLKVCCDNNTNFSYGYIRHRKLPCNYKGYYIERLKIINE